MELKEQPEQTLLQDGVLMMFIHPNSGNPYESISGKITEKQSLVSQIMSTLCHDITEDINSTNRPPDHFSAKEIFFPAPELNGELSHQKKGKKHKWMKQVIYL